jgi:polyhydroxybutyrate depolymerase
MRARLAALALVGILAACSSSQTGDAAPPAAPGGGGSQPDAAPPDEPDPRLAGRPYQVYVPPGLDDGTPAPLVLAFHGYGSGDNGALLEKFFKLKAVADEARFLYVTPDGTKDPGGERFWNGTDACCDFYSKKPDDVGYVRALVADVAKTHKVDPKRVYAVGLSGGAFFVHRLACDASDVLAAVVSMSGATYADASKCRPKEPVAVVELHGEKDDVVRFEGGEIDTLDVHAKYPSAKETVARWAAYDGCTGALEDAGLTLDLFTMTGQETRVSRYAGCARGAAELWTVKDGPHAPMMNAGFGKAIWSFFAAHPKP